MRDPEQGLITSPSAPSPLSRTADRVAWFASAVGLERWARLVAVLVVPVLLPRPLLEEYGLAVVALVAYVALTAAARRDRVLRAADLVVAAALIVAVGPDVPAFLPFLLVSIAGPASQGGTRAGIAAGGTLATILLVRLAFDPQIDEIRMDALVPLVLLLPLGGFTTAAASELLEERSVRGRMVLQQANRLLSSLSEIADEIPGGLDLSTVAAAILAELRSLGTVTGAVVYAEDRGLLRPSAAAGLAQRRLPNLRLDELRGLASSPGQLRSPHQLPDGLHEVCGSHQYWIVQPLGELVSLPGVVLAGFDRLEDAREARGRISSIAVDGTLAFENARLFDGTSARAADAARRRVASDLHDGVAQELTHLKMELELLAMQQDVQGEQREVARLARVATRALTELRSTIGELRRSPSDDLGRRLEAYLDDLRTGHGPVIELEWTGDATLTSERSEEVLRVAQEAISNALRHAHAGTITVTLELDESTVFLAVEDDGIGFTDGSPNAGGGIGLKSMRERAARLSGELEIRQRLGGGTLLALRLPIEPVSRSSRG